MKKLRKMSNDTNSTLVQRIKSGDERAFQILIANNTQLINSIIKRMTVGGRLEQAHDDFVQIVYIKIWEKIDTLEDVNIKGWISYITKNAVLDSIRKVNRVQTLSTSNTNNQFDEEESSFEFFIKDKTQNPEESLINQEMAEAIRTALDSPELKDVHKKVLNLRYVEGLKYDEISAELGLNLETVKGIIFKTKVILREKLKNA